MGTERIGQQAFAHFLERGELDRHLRRMRGRYRARRDALVQALADELPEPRSRASPPAST
jgi:GntR family transcriptional regulator/MocR family aminotransferase